MAKLIAWILVGALGYGWVYAYAWFDEPEARGVLLFFSFLALAVASRSRKSEQV
ncbi:MAG: hypothetical protein ACE5HP_12660 [Gemmatimonadota bacterium]